MIIKRIYKTLRYLVNKLRAKYYLNIVGSYKGNVYFGGKCSFTNNVFLGDNVSFNGIVINGYGKVYIGDNFHSGVKCRIITSNHNYDSGKYLPYDSSNIIKNTTIGDNVWFGDCVIITPGITIGEGAIIQAGAVVVNDIPPLGIAGGNPAKVFKYRDKEHYFELKSKKKYLTV